MAIRRCPGPSGPRASASRSRSRGDPKTHLTFHGWHPESIASGLERNNGIVATAMHCVSAVPVRLRAEPGIKTYLDLPLIAGRAAPHLGALVADPVGTTGADSSGPVPSAIARDAEGTLGIGDRDGESEAFDAFLRQLVDDDPAQLAGRVEERAAAVAGFTAASVCR